ncbi:MAG TPA: hypothetical protein PLB57_00615 [bacterium]|nr:hypothetical protein [bacterium]HRS72903.1 hypothetical protein [Patescibacteria group bacterium]
MSIGLIKFYASDRPRRLKNKINAPINNQPDNITTLTKPSQPEMAGTDHRRHSKLRQTN